MKPWFPMTFSTEPTTGCICTGKTGCRMPMCGDAYGTPILIAASFMRGDNHLS